MPNLLPSARENIAVPDHLKRQIVFKWPDLNIRRYTYSIVAPDEVAVFMYQGQVRGMLPPGRHRLDATDIPFLGLFADHVTGGNLYRTELYFVGSREYPGIASGAGSTMSKILLPDWSSRLVWRVSIPCVLSIPPPY
jgi:membrane protease subunit (stomatin/prohibitin family)